MVKRQIISRRSFVVGGIGFPFIVPRFVLGGTVSQVPSDKLRIAGVGVGGMGQSYLGNCRHEQIVALCDVDHNLAGKVFKRFPGARCYHDWRKMFAKEADNFDAVIIATPDHTHTVILMAAIEMGKHIYCAKPITHNIGEARRVRMALAANKHLVTKSSVQSSGTESSRNTTEVLKSGVIGPVREVHVWCHHPAYPCSLVRPTEKQSPPAEMDWDLWLGPAPYRPFNTAYHPSNWRPWWDFGSGTVGDMGCHTFHTYFKELRLGTPTVVYGNASGRHKGFFQHVSTPECQSHANMVTWEYGARGDLEPLKVYWYDGGMKPHRPGELDRSLSLQQSGVLFVGDKGKLLTGYGGGNPYGKSGRGISGGLLLAEGKFADFEQPAKTTPRCNDHYGEWTRACKSGGTTVCPVEFGSEMTELALLGALALRTRGLLEWDSEKMRITNNDKANSFVDPPYRKGWEL